jgi:hypothetical protein
VLPEEVAKDHENLIRVTLVATLILIWLDRTAHLKTHLEQNAPPEHASINPKNVEYQEPSKS